MFLIWLDTREAFHLLHLFVFTKLDPVVLIEIICVVTRLFGLWFCKNWG